MFDNLKLDYDPQHEEVRARFAITPGDVRKLYAALADRKLDWNGFEFCDEDKDCWFCGWIHTRDGQYSLGADYETGEIRVGCAVYYLNPYEAVAPPPDEYWPRFIAPLTRLREVLQ